MSSSIATSTGEKVVVVLRDKKGRIKQVSGKHIPKTLRIRAWIDGLRRKLDPE